eukprot:gene15151-21217_t
MSPSPTHTRPPAPRDLSWAGGPFESVRDSVHRVVRGPAIPRAQALPDSSPGKNCIYRTTKAVKLGESAVGARAVHPPRCSRLADSWSGPRSSVTGRTPDAQNWESESIKAHAQSRQASAAGSGRKVPVTEGLLGAARSFREAVGVDGLLGDSCGKPDAIRRIKSGGKPNAICRIKSGGKPDAIRRIKSGGKPDAIRRIKSGGKPDAIRRIKRGASLMSIRRIKMVAEPNAHPVRIKSGGKPDAIRRIKSGGKPDAIRRIKSGGKPDAIRRIKSGGKPDAIRRIKSGGKPDAIRRIKSGGKPNAIRRIKSGGKPDPSVASSGGKPDAIRHIKETFDLETVVMVGDGATDLEARLEGAADVFIGYGGAAVRANVAAKADWYVFDFHRVVDALK